MNKRTSEFIRKEAQTQIEAGAEYIELNALSLLTTRRRSWREIIPMLESWAPSCDRQRERRGPEAALLISKEPIIVGAVE